MKTRLTVLLFCLAAGCGTANEAPGPVTMNDLELENWQIALVETRIDKNEAFMDSTQTALRPDDRAGFEGLNYYDPDPALRFRVPFLREARPDTVMLVKRKGNQLPYVKAGKVSFRIGGRTLTLWVYSSPGASQEEGLWLPFFDETSGRETYAGGRYLDLKPETDGQFLVLDFNYAYNPLCDYNPERYNCTLPPAENRLTLPVRAGEKSFRAQGH